MLTQEKAELQASSPQTWDKPTAQANIGDLFRIPYTAIMQVVDKDILDDGRVRVLVKPLTGALIEEWIIEPEPVTPLSAPSTTQPENTPVSPPSGLNSPSCKLQPAWSSPRRSRLMRHAMRLAGALIGTLRALRSGASSSLLHTSTTTRILLSHGSQPVSRY